jgi:alkylation response protein AidB-like acyl-CoA dehydrogenase
VKEILPTQVDGDRIGVHFDNGKVTVPESFHKAWKALRDGEWLAMTEDPEWGGQGMPRPWPPPPPITSWRRTSPSSCTRA